MTSNNILRFYSNTASQTNLTSGISDTDTSLTLVSASGYPDTTPFSILISGEIILVGARSGAVFSNLERGFGGTLAVAHTTAETVEHRAVANDFENRWQDAIVTRPGGLYDDEFDDESISTDWSTVSVTGTTTWVESNGILSFSTANQTANDCSPILKSMGSLSPPIYITTAIRMWGPSSNYLMAGPLFSDGTAPTNNVVWQMPYISNGRLRISHRSGTFTSISSEHYSLDMSYTAITGWLFQRLSWQATNTWKTEWSIDGVSWSDFGYTNDTYTLSPTHFGIGVSTWGGTYTMLGSVEFFRVE